MENSLCCNNSCAGWKQAIWVRQCQQREIHGLIYLSKDFPRESLGAYWFPSGFFLSSTPSAQESASTERPARSLFLCSLQRSPPYARPLKGSRGERRSKFANTKHQEDVHVLMYVSSTRKDQARVSSDTKSSRHFWVAAAPTSQNSWEQFIALLMNLGYCW